jgi:hypothetical protein
VVANDASESVHFSVTEDIAAAKGKVSDNAQKTRGLLPADGLAPPAKVRLQNIVNSQPPCLDFRIESHGESNTPPRPKPSLRFSLPQAGRMS